MKAADAATEKNMRQKIILSSEKVFSCNKYKFQEDIV